MTQTIIARECKFAVHIPSKHHEMPDLHLIKERLLFSDGSEAPNVQIVKNFKRPYYIATKASQTYSQKREWETLDNLNRFDCTQSDLRYSIAKALGKPWSKDPLKKLSASPYLYGSDVTSTAYIKMMYMKKYPDIMSAYAIANLDIETDVVHGHNQIIMMTITYK